MKKVGTRSWEKELHVTTLENSWNLLSPIGVNHVSIRRMFDSLTGILNQSFQDSVGHRVGSTCGFLCFGHSKGPCAIYLVWRAHTLCLPLLALFQTSTKGA